MQVKCRVEQKNSLWLSLCNPLNADPKTHIYILLLPSLERYLSILKKDEGVHNFRMNKKRMVHDQVTFGTPLESCYISQN